MPDEQAEEFVEAKDHGQYILNRNPSPKDCLDRRFYVKKIEEFKYSKGEANYYCKIFVSEIKDGKRIRIKDKFGLKKWGEERPAAIFIKKGDVPIELREKSQFEMDLTYHGKHLAWKLNLVVV